MVCEVVYCILLIRLELVSPALLSLSLPYFLPIAMSDFLAPRSLKRSARAISSPTERTPARTAPISKKRRHSRLFSLEHAYNPATSSDDIPIPANFVISPLRLGNLPIPRLNFDSDSSDSDAEAEADADAEPAAEPVVVDSDASNNNSIIPQAAGLKTPHRPRAIPVRRILAATPASPVAATQSAVTAREARRLRVKPAPPNAPRRKSLGALHQSSRVKDVAALFSNM
ncbi:unnamed protein product [Caenorhabditis angaria]|uniref:Uncharacterized protein n=1 Tax=Caenorhabditis angaria TaxID=860376 RepID=A0A9P1MV39_9PELO|nr:unnamed protein product [Caenorhabditis angaria]